MATISIAPARARSRSRGLVITLTGAGTAWLSSSPVFTASAGSVGSQAVTGDATATLTFDAPPNAADVTITDPTTGATAVLTVRVPPSARYYGRRA